MCFKSPHPDYGGIVMFTNPDEEGVRKAYSMILCEKHWNKLFEFLRYLSGEEDWYNDQAEE